MISHAETLIGVDVNPAAGNYMKQSEKARFFNGTTQEFAKELQEPIYKTIFCWLTPTMQKKLYYKIFMTISLMLHDMA